MLPLLLALLLTAPPQRDEVVEMRVTPASVPVGGLARIEIQVVTEGESPRRIDSPPLPAGLQQVSSSDFSELRLSLPGRARRVLRREMVVRAARPGTYVIPPAAVLLGRQRIRSGPATLEVTDAFPWSGESGWDAADVLLNARLDADTVYVGQQVTLEAEVLFPEDLRRGLRAAPEFQAPSPGDFWIHDIPIHRADLRLVNGRVYRHQRFTRAYFPLTPGSYNLGSAVLLYETRGSLFNPAATREIRSQPLRVEVLAVPEGAPAGFTGAVGDFRLRAHVEPAAVAQGEAVTLTVELEGEGYVKALPPPLLPALPATEIYPPSERAELQVASNGRIGGVKRFQWILAPQEVGRLQLPPIRYAYFDPIGENFETAVADPGELDVRPRAVAAGSGEAGTTRLRPTKQAPAAGLRLQWVRSPGFLAFQTVPLLLIAAVGLHRRGGRRRGAPRRRVLVAVYRRGIADLPPSLSPSERAGALCRIAREYLANRLAEPDLRRATVPRLRGLLADRGALPGTASDLAELLEALETTRYAQGGAGFGEDPTRAGDVERRLDDLLSRVDREAPPPARLLRGGKALLLALVAVVGTATSGFAADEGTYRAALDAQRAGQSALAERAWLGYLEENPRDAHAWYNLGALYFEQERRGRAVWAWLRSFQQNPRDADLRHNLRMAGVSSPSLREAMPTAPLRREELLLLAALAWWLAAGCAALWLYRRGVWRAVAGTASLILAGVLGAVAVVDEGDRGVVLSDRVVAGSAPTLARDTVAVFSEATVVRVERERGGWTLVRTEGARGWIPANAVGRL